MVGGETKRTQKANENLLDGEKSRREEALREELFIVVLRWSNLKDDEE